MRVGRHHKPVSGGDIQQRTVVALEQVVVVEGAGEQFVDQLCAHTAPRAVVHVDAAVFEVDGAQVGGFS